MKRRVADIVVDLLKKNGIADCFVVVGGGAMHLNNALALNKDIKKYFNHHEQASAMAAEAYARYSGRLAAVCVTSGPGGTNTLTGVMGAWQDSLPLLVISGQVRYETTVEASGLPLRYRGIQEFDIVNSIGNMTKYAKLITDPLSVKREIQKAIDISLSGRRGPVWIDIPLDIQSTIIETGDLYPIESIEYGCLRPDDDELKKAFERLKNAKRPCILAGNGIRNSDSVDAFRDFVDLLEIPVLGAAISADALYTEHPLYYGLSGIIGPRTGNFIIQNADVILSLGCSLGYKMTGFERSEFAPHAHIISVDVDSYEMKKPGVKIGQFIHSDLSAFFKEAIEVFDKISIDNEWIQYCDKLRDRFSPFSPGKNVAKNEKVTSYYFWERYKEKENEDSISVLGNNTANSVKLQIGIRKKNQRIIANNNCGSMGADLPQAIGVAVASNKEVICITGDGSIMMNLQEIQTIVHNKLPVKIIVFSNDGYNAIRQTCKNYFNNMYIGCTPDSGISFPDFKKIANAFDLPYRKCATNYEVDEALSWIFAHKGQAFLEVLQKFDDPVIPKVMSRMKDDGTFLTPALHDMAPFLDPEEVETLMFW